SSPLTLESIYVNITIILIFFVLIFILICFLIFFYVSSDAPKFPSVSVSPSAEIVEGSSVTLTCSSDANPAANYTWFKEDEDSPTASGQIFNINNTSPEHSGHYICIAQNTRGRHNSTVHLTVLEGKLHPHCFTGHMTL
uniref:Ig-like domain-containing protein n=1 Tax=Labrus bergylta TaxID=56723 RepID=A0A3Q3M871_9LABR